MKQDNGKSGMFSSKINKVNPTPDRNALSITGLIKQGGKISGYMLSNGQKVSRDEGVVMAKNNKIKGVGVAVNQGTEYLRALPDGEEGNNLSNLPTVGIE